MGGGEALAGQSVHVITRQLMGGSIGDGVNDGVQPVPVFLQFREEVGNLPVTAHVEGQGDVRSQFGRKLLHRDLSLSFW